jgi:hypothetical protein
VLSQRRLGNLSPLSEEADATADLDVDWVWRLDRHGILLNR